MATRWCFQRWGRQQAYNSKVPRLFPMLWHLPISSSYKLTTNHQLPITNYQTSYEIVSDWTPTALGERIAERW